MGLVEAISFAGGCLGSGLGIFNTWNGWWRGRPHLRISEKLELFDPYERRVPAYTIRLENNGRVAVAIEKVTFYLSEAKFKKNVVIWRRSFDSKQDIVIEPGRSQEFPIIPEVFYVAKAQDKAQIVVLAEDGAKFKKRCRKWADFYSYQTAAIEVATRPG